MTVSRERESYGLYLPIHRLLSKEKGIETQIVLDAVKDALLVAARKHYRTNENYIAELNEKRLDRSVCREKSGRNRGESRLEMTSAGGAPRRSGSRRIVLLRVEHQVRAFDPLHRAVHQLTTRPEYSL